jgi:putative Mg2+ transporter-C (MgtC) family protein
MAHKEAGMRTFALVSLGSCVFTILSTLFSQDAASRILANIVVGIGFLGGGLIFTQRDHIRGLTTAAALWTTAALGAVIGLGKYGLGFLITILVLFLLAVVGRWELKIRKEENI